MFEVRIEAALVKVSRRNANNYGFRFMKNTKGICL